MEPSNLFGWWLAGTSGLFAVLFPLSRIFGARMPRMFQALWLVFFVKLLVPVGIWSPAGAFRTQLVPAGPVASASVGAPEGGQGEAPPAASLSRASSGPSAISELPISPFDWAAVLGAVWLGGVVVFGALSVWAHGRTLGRPAAGPAAVGILRPRLVLPSDFGVRFTPLEQHLILAHERTHLRVGDPLWFCFSQAVTCLFWWFPVVWWARNEFRAVAELACDASVLGGRSDDEARIYGQLMVRLASEDCRTAGVAFAGTFSVLKRRLTAAVRPVRWRGPWVLGLLLVSAGALGALSFTPPRPDWVWPVPPPNKLGAQYVISGAAFDRAFAHGVGVTVGAGTLVRAAADGTIVEVLADPDRGWTLKVAQSGGVQTWYGHLDLDPVPIPGTQVSQGDKVGLVHQPASSFPVSFCLAVVQNGTAVDLAGLFPGVPLGSRPDFMPGPLVWPLAGEVGTPGTSFGPAIHPFTGQWYFHKGTDKEAPGGTSVRSVTAGTVSRVALEALG